MVFRGLGEVKYWAVCKALGTAKFGVWKGEERGERMRAWRD